MGCFDQMNTTLAFEQLYVLYFLQFTAFYNYIKISFKIYYAILEENYAIMLF